MRAQSNSRRFQAYQEKPKYGSRKCSPNLVLSLFALLSVSVIAWTLISNNDTPSFRGEGVEVEFKKQPYYVPDGASMNTVGSVKQCTPEQSAFQAENIAAAKVRGCPPGDDAWMRIVHLLMPNPGVNGPGVFVDIGSNKGFTAARWYQLWNPELGMSPPKLASLLRKVSDNQQVLECGACSDCRDDKKPYTSIGSRVCGVDSATTMNGKMRKGLEVAVKGVCRKRMLGYQPLRVYSFDGNNILVDAVNKAKHAYSEYPSRYDKDFMPEFLFAKPAPVIEENWSIELAAFSNTYTPGKTMTFVQNGELGHLISDDIDEESRPKSNQEGTRVEVPVLSIDAFFAEERLSHIDFLKIDTEGHDMTVLAGATDVLKNRAVTLLMFELNEFAPQGSSDGYSTLLEKTIKETLGKNDYICYLEGKNVMVRLTYCWHSLLSSINEWSNVWCAQAQSPIGRTIITVFDGYSLAFI